MNNDAKLFARFASVVMLASAFLTVKVYAAEPVAVAGYEPRSVTVKFEDLNLNSPAGAAALYQRIHRAAGEVCGQPGSERNLASRSTQQGCVAAAEGRAVKQIGSGNLSAYYAKRVSTNLVVAFNDAK